MEGGRDGGRERWREGGECERRVLKEQFLAVAYCTLKIHVHVHAPTLHYSSMVIVIFTVEINDDGGGRDGGRNEGRKGWGERWRE